MKKIVIWLLDLLWLQKTKKFNENNFLKDKVFAKIYEKCHMFTMTSPERMYALYSSVNHIIDNNIDWAIVECGVRKGWSAMVAAYTLIERNISNRDIHLYDTFEWMSDPTSDDEDIWWQQAKYLLNKENKKNSVVWAYSPLDEVMINIKKTWYPLDKFIIVKWDVEKTMPENLPQKIALLRLDTDRFNSTYHELNCLYPLLTSKGFLIIDDYWHRAWAKKAVDKYLKEYWINSFLHRIDYTWILLIKN